MHPRWLAAPLLSRTRSRSLMYPPLAGVRPPNRPRLYARRQGPVGTAPSPDARPVAPSRLDWPRSGGVPDAEGPNQSTDGAARSPGGTRHLRGVARRSRRCSTATAPPTRTARPSRNASASSSGQRRQARPVGSHGHGRGLGAEPLADAARHGGRQGVRQRGLGHDDHLGRRARPPLRHGRHPLGGAAGLPAGGRRALPLDVQHAEHRPGRRQGDRHDVAVRVARARHLEPRERQRGHDAALPLAQRPRQPQPARVRSGQALHAPVRVERQTAGRRRDADDGRDARLPQERARLRARRHDEGPRARRQPPTRRASTGTPTASASWRIASRPARSR